MKRYKVLIGEWVSVYATTRAIIKTDKDIENMTASQIANLLDNDDNTTIDTEDSDYDWSTEEHEDWDRHDNGITILEQMPEPKDEDNEDND